MNLRSLLIGFALLATNVFTMGVVAQNKAEVAEKNYGVSVDNSPQNARLFFKSYSENSDKLFSEDFVQGIPSANKKTETSGAYENGRPEVIYGTMLNATKNYANGMYSFQTDFGGFTLHSANTDLFSMAPGALIDDNKYILIMNTATTYTAYRIFDATTWELLEDVTDAPAKLGFQCIAYNPKDKKLYGLFKNYGVATTYDFGYADLESGTRTTIKNLKSETWKGMAFTKDGDLYAINTKGILLKIDPATGDQTTVGDTGIGTPTFFTCCMSEVSNVMYIVASGKSPVYCDYLRAVNLATGETTNVREMPSTALMMGIFVGPSAVDDDAVPNVISDLSLNFDKASLEGEMKFTLPINIYGGQTGTSQLGYVVYRNGEVIKDVAPHDSVKWGSTVTLKEVVPALGKYTYYVKAKNRVGEGPRAEETLWVGNDYPAAVSNPLLEYSADSLRFNITWTAPKKSANGGYIDLSKLTYNIYDKDNKMIATGLTECKYAVPEANPDAVEKWMFTITAVHEGLESNSKNTNTIGFNTPPLYEPWEIGPRFEEWSVIDVNNDYHTWEFPYYYANKGYVWVSGNSSAKNGMDDWLITPPLKLEAGKEYDLYVAATTSNNAAPQSFEIGLGADIKPMTKIILETQQVTTTDSVSYKCSFRVDSTAIYYIGLHANTEGYRGSLQVLDFALEAGVSLQSPGLGKLTVSPDRQKFTLKAEVEYETPTKTVGGETLNAITKVDFYRDDVLVKTVENPTPGSKVTFTDSEGISLGDHRWRVVPINEAGPGKGIIVSEYVGVYQTTAPTDIKMVELDDNGTVNLSWKAPEKDVMGNDIPANLVRYNIYSKAGQPVSKDIEGTTVTLQSTSATQNFIYFMLTSSTDAGENRSSIAYTPIVAVGTPYKLPFVESCGSMIIGHNWGLSAVDGGNKWQLAGGCDSPVCYPQDNDGGMWAWIPKYLDDMSMVYSGKILLSGENPTLSFFYRAIKGSEDKIDVAVRVMGDEKWTVLKSFPLAAPGVDDWAKGFVSLNDYNGKKVQVAWIGYSKKADAVICMDNMRIEQVWAKNMQINKFNAPNRVGVAEEYVAVATVENMGTEAAQGVTVSLLRDGNVVATSPAADYAVGERAEVELRDKTLSMFAKDKSIYQVVINYAADENPEDNKSANVEVNVEKSSAPVVTDLKAAENEGKYVSLNWTAPVVEGNPSDIVTEDFENFTPWETANVGKWTLFTGNNAIRAYSGTPYPNALTPYPFIVFDTTYPGFSKSDYQPYSGNQYMASFCAEYGANDDWLVSPELNGIKQTVSFMARSFTIDYGAEEFEFFYSLTDAKRESFVKVAEVHDVPVQWTKYTYEIPEGAKYFAIHCISNDRLAFFVDDVTYDRGGGGIRLLGYNVYRDGVKLNSDLVKETSFDDKTVEVGNHEWNVTVVYDVAESNLSNTAKLDYTDVETLVVENVTVTVEQRTIVVRGAEGENVTVYTPDGKVIYNAETAVETSVKVEMTGVYLVKVADNVVKVIVK